MLKIKNNILYSCLCSNPSRDRRLHMSEIFSIGTKNPQTNKNKTSYIHRLRSRSGVCIHCT